MAGRLSNSYQVVVYAVVAAIDECWKCFYQARSQSKSDDAARRSKRSKDILAGDIVSIRRWGLQGGVIVPDMNT